MEDFFDMLYTRQSCRNFDAAKPVEEEKLFKCVEAGRMAPSACNSQPWHFYAVKDNAAVSGVREAVMPMGANGFAKNVNAFIAVAGEKPPFTERAAQIALKRGFADMDVGIAVAHIVLAAEAQGLSTCILGLFDDSKLKNALKLTGEKRFKVVIAVGYAAAEDPIRPKKRKDTVDICTVI